MAEQPDKCFEHHMMLKKELENFKKEIISLLENKDDFFKLVLKTLKKENLI